MKIIAGKKTRVGKYVFDSQLEAEHYQYLKEREDVKIIELQPEFELFPRFKYFNVETGKEQVYSRMVYTPDFLIELKGHPKRIAIEVKGFRRADYMMRRKLFIMNYNSEIDFIETDKVGKLHMILGRIQKRNEKLLNQT